MIAVPVPRLQSAPRSVLDPAEGLLNQTLPERDLVLMLHAGADAAGHGPGSERPAATARLRYAGEAVSVQW